MPTHTDSSARGGLAYALILLVALACSAPRLHAQSPSFEQAMAQNARALGTQLVMRGQERGARLLRRAAANGDAKAQYNLAVAYMTGAVHGVPQPQAALLWYTAAAAAGFAPAAYNAGVLHAAKRVPGASPEHATYWMCRAANLRHTRALRWLYAHRDGVASCHGRG
ncbi:hypothetical protein [Algiphilus sp.]|uniref:hypothetical protein n=1 Tax=Algiphilus sp. TaxID=1872431 RepID=UPI003B527513